MSGPVYQFTFAAEIPFESVEVTLLRAILAAEALHGETQVRLDAAHCLDAEQRTCVIDARTDVGRDLNRLFAGFACREFGPDAFRVRRQLAHSAGSSTVGVGGCCD